MFFHKSLKTPHLGLGRFLRLFKSFMGSKLWKENYKLKLLLTDNTICTKFYVISTIQLHWDPTYLIMYKHIVWYDNSLFPMANLEILYFPFQRLLAVIFFFLMDIVIKPTWMIFENISVYKGWFLKLVCGNIWSQ